jgi:putative Holliday junction resolvase
MGRLIGLDVGAKRTGLATTDSLHLIASPLETVETNQLIDVLKRLHDKESIDGLVVGVPLLIVGGTTDSHPHIRRVIHDCTQAFPGIPIHQVDESSTSLEASSIQRLGGMKKSKRQAKGSLDAIAASLILQRHLDASALQRK